MEVRDHLPLAELERLEREERDARRSKRLRIIILAIKGYTAPAIAMSLGLSRRVCQDWVYRFNEQGLQGLEDQWGGHRQGPLTPEEEQQMRQRLDGGPTPEDDVCSLRGVDVQRILAQEFGVLRSLPAVYYLPASIGLFISAAPAASSQIRCGSTGGFSASAARADYDDCRRTSGKTGACLFPR